MNSSISLKTVAVIGGGFAGLAGVRKLLKKAGKNNFRVVLISPYFVFLPLLPDVVADNVEGETLSYDFSKEKKNKKFVHLDDFVTQIDEKENRLVLKSGEDLIYDYLLICAGAKQAFVFNNGYTSNSLMDAKKIRRKAIASIIDKKKINAYAVGGGYTGVEYISALKSLNDKFEGENNHFTLVEKNENILNGIDESIRNMTENNLKKSGVMLEMKKEIIEKENDFFLNGRKIEASIVISTGGLKGAFMDFSSFKKHKKSGRLLINEYLRLNGRIFAAGDCAIIERQMLRQSVNFAISQGGKAANNIIALIENKTMKEYRPLDPGYVIPCYSVKKAAGKSFFFKIPGKIGLFVHYFMCFYHLPSVKNKKMLIRDFIKNYVFRFFWFK